MLERVEAVGTVKAATSMSLTQFLQWLAAWEVAEVDHVAKIRQIHENWLKNPDKRRTEAYVARVLEMKMGGLNHDQWEILRQRLLALLQWYQDLSPEMKERIESV